MTLQRVIDLLLVHVGVVTPDQGVGRLVARAALDVLRPPSSVACTKRCTTSLFSSTILRETLMVVW
jgi:hypothetical protein